MADKNTVYMSEKQKVKEITDKLEAGLKELFESEKYKSYLSTMSKFHNYSFNNTLLIAMQKPEATLVAGYQAWQKNFERHVNKGEKAIRILAPAPYKIKEERDKLDPVTGEMMFDENGMPQKEETEVTIPAFRAVSVFDVSQTDGKPIPELEVNELLSTVEGYEDFVQALMNISPVPIAFEDIPGDSKGYFSTAEKRIAVQENMSESQTLKTMVHEVAHSMLHDKEVNQSMDIPVKDRNKLQKGLQELGEEGAIQVFTGEFGNILLGAVGQLQFEIVAQRLATEYKVDAIYESTDVSTARWLSFPDEQTRKDFCKEQDARLATDVNGNTVYLATSIYNLETTMKHWPQVVFHTTREMQQTFD